VGSRLTGKRLGRWLTEQVNGGGAAAEIRAMKQCSEGGTAGRRWGLPWGARSEDGGGKRGPRRVVVVRLLFERGWVRQGSGGGRATWLMSGGSGARAGGSLPTGERRPAGSGPKPAGACDVHHARATGRTGGEGREGREWRAGARGPAREVNGVVEPYEQ
jgi:hypothetical protein